MQMQEHENDHQYLLHLAFSARAAIDRDRSAIAISLSSAVLSLLLVDFGGKMQCPVYLCSISSSARA
jgi:hypothetical protein